MGSMTVVHCPSCGYESHQLFGVGGDYGMDMDQMVVTVACQQDHELHDTVTPMGDSGSGLGDDVIVDVADCGDDLLISVDSGAAVNQVVVVPDAGPCPTCGGLHPGWNPQAAPCPRCGRDGCDLIDVGCWD